MHSLTYSAVMAMGAPIGMLIPIFLVDRLGRRTVVATASFLAAAVGIGYAFALDAPAWLSTSRIAVLPELGIFTGLRF